MKGINIKMIEQNLKKIQTCCLEITKDIHRVCKEFGIQYSLCGGSVIGAHLYKGFIPWDDDIDLMMTRENYDRFLEIYPKYGNKKYHLHHYSIDGVENLPTLFSRVEDTSTYIKEEIAGGNRSGHIFVDITVFDYIPDNFYNSWIHWYGAYVYSFLYRMNGMIPGTGWKKILFTMLPKNVDKNHLLKKFSKYEQILRKHSKLKKGKKMAELLSAAYGGILYESELFSEYKEVSFEGTNLMVISDYKEYLFTRYGKRGFQKEMDVTDRQKAHIQEVLFENQEK